MLRRSPGKYTRQQLYDMIRRSSKDEYVLNEMIRLGFWNENEAQPSLPAELIAKKGELEREFQALVKTQQQYSDPAQVLKTLHKERKAKALEKREETRQKNSEKRYRRTKAWYGKNQREITFLGHGVSKGLQGRFTDTDRLASQDLPAIDTSMALATAMGVTINELRFLSFDRKTARTTHYKQFLIAKKTGGTRRISAPMPRLKRLQYWILENILLKLPLNGAAHGFVPRRSIVTNALPHLGADMVINLDLKDFFPTITYGRIKGLFCGLGYSEHVSTILALLCSASEVDQVRLDNDTFFVARGQRHLPQGAPTSPAISNLICRRLDARLEGISQSLGYTYTRYADDLTFSGSREAGAGLTKLFWRVEQIVSDEGFVIHPDKTRIMRNNSRQEVTGIVVNQKPSVDRRTLKRFRALLFQIEKDGPGDKKWGKGELIPSIDGYANFVYMVNPEKGKKFKTQIAVIKQKYGYRSTPVPLTHCNKKRMRAKAARGMAPSRDFWQASPPPPPISPPAQEKKESNPSVETASRVPPQPPEPQKIFPTKRQCWIILYILLFLMLMSRLLR